MRKSAADSGTPFLVDLEDAARSVQRSPLAVALLGAAGCPTLDRFCPRADSAAEIALYFGVSRSAAADWVKHGCPQNANGTFNLVAVREWRLRQPKPPDVFTKAAAALRGHRASGDLTRAIYRMLPMQISEAGPKIIERFLADIFPNAEEPAANKLRDKLYEIINEELSHLCLSEPEVEQLLVECAEIV